TPREAPPVGKNHDGATPKNGANFGGTPSPRGIGASPAGVSPAPFHAVASAAPVLVSTGGPDPIRLGDRGSYVPNGTLHVWDWGEGTQSRPLKVATGKAMAVSPDGKWVVIRDGQLVEVATSAVRRLDNFDGNVHG